jgi:hypothetical protein
MDERTGVHGVVVAGARHDPGPGRPAAQEGENPGVLHHGDRAGPTPRDEEDLALLRFVTDRAGRHHHGAFVPRDGIPGARHDARFHPEAGCGN